MYKINKSYPLVISGACFCQLFFIVAAVTSIVPTSIPIKLPLRPPVFTRGFCIFAAVIFFFKMFLVCSLLFAFLVLNYMDPPNVVLGLESTCTIFNVVLGPTCGIRLMKITTSTVSFISIHMSRSTTISVSGYARFTIVSGAFHRVRQNFVRIVDN